MFKIIPSLNANRAHYSTITVDELITKIKANTPAVIEARAYGKYTNRQEYDRIKTTAIEAYLPCSFDGISTGYIYLDIDGFNSKQETLQYKSYLIEKHKDLIFACWVSLSEHGLSILVKVDDLDKLNYPDYWKELNTVFEYKLDGHSKGFEKVNCISYDEHVYHNPDSLNYELKEKVTRSLIYPEYNKEPRNLFGKEVKEEVVNKRPRNLFESNLIPIKYRTPIDPNLFSCINTPLVYANGIKVLEIDSRYFQAYRIQEGQRNKVLAALSMTLMVLNPLPEGYDEKVLRGQLLNALHYMNKHYTVTPLSEGEVINIFNSNYKRFKKQGYFDVERYKKTKYIIWHPECNIPFKERMSIGNKLFAKSRGKGKEFTESIINDSIEVLQDSVNPINQQKVSEHTGLKLSTVKKYWKTFKPLVEAYNEQLQRKTMNEQQPLAHEMNDGVPIQIECEVLPIKKDREGLKAKGDTPATVKDNGVDITKMPTTVGTSIDLWFCAA